MFQKGKVVIGAPGFSISRGWFSCAGNCMEKQCSSVRRNGRVRVCVCVLRQDVKIQLLTSVCMRVFVRASVCFRECVWYHFLFTGGRVLQVCLRKQSCGSAKFLPPQYSLESLPPRSRVAPHCGSSFSSEIATSISHMANPELCLLLCNAFSPNWLIATVVSARKVVMENKW